MKPFEIILIFTDYISLAMQLVEVEVAPFHDLNVKAGLKESFVMTAVNDMGFYMNPDKKSYEEYFKNDDNTVLAMASLASGRLKPEEAYKALHEKKCLYDNYVDTYRKMINAAKICSASYSGCMPVF